MSSEAVNTEKPSASETVTPDVPHGYKRTEVGVIPETWQPSRVGHKGEVLTGKALAVNAPGQERPYLRTKNVLDGKIDIGDVLRMPMTDAQFEHFSLRRGDVLLNEGQSLELVGRCAIYRNEFPQPCAIQNQLLRFRARAGVSADFASHLFRYCQHIGIFARVALQTTSMAHLGGSRFERLLLPWPESETEQGAIAEALSDMDGLLGGLDTLIAKKRAIKQGAMEQLLTGKTRLPGFRGEWVTKKIGEVASPSNEKNTNGADLPVLTCSKHQGFMDSLRYFKTQVFSNDLTGYKIIRRGQIGYPANHIEEGSIGLQDLYDVALVSPIYIVCSPNQGVNAYFLHRLLKLESYRQKFSTATTSSIDRRGSLRWPAFSGISVAIPCAAEQTTIAEILSDMEREIAALDRQRNKAALIKQGMMDHLLTGRVRLVEPSPAEAGA